MKMNKKIKILFIILVAVFIGATIIGITTAQAAERELEIEYPNVPSAITPNTIKTLLPNYIKYIISFGIVFSGIIIFGSMLFAGFLYMTSSGNPASMKDSKGRILSSFLGIIILLSSYLILNTINPNLIILQIKGLGSTKGVVFIGADDEYITRTDVPNFDETGITPNQVNILSPNVEVIACAQPCVRENPGFDCFDVSNCPGPAITTETPGPQSFSGMAAKIVWKTPGVYLYDETDYKGDLRVYTASMGTLDDFNSKAKSIKFLSSSEDEKFGAILHTGEGFEGQCKLIINVDELANLGPSNARSITVFKYKVNGNAIAIPPLDASGVMFFNSQNYINDNYFVPQSFQLEETWTPFSENGIEDNGTYSLKIDGNYLVAIAEETGGTGECEVFLNSDSDLMDNRIAQCTILGDCSPGCPGLWGFCPVCTGSCASSFIVIPLTR
ncbi:MAG: hypothetical protein COU70_00625 [Parcubacteria group bacterium CG10_big_fil_rev_8_21_14_0_10_35_15]|nr:MAG: hypothetical protein COU70_00625 [Parcubacteria group bacterium CG10_big_fil_rev_8_21_14_0_10_35_15]